MKKILVLSLLLLTCAYTLQAAFKLKRSLSSLSDCQFSVYTERVDLGTLSVPVPKLSCMAKEGEYVWTPTRNAWIRIGC